MKASTYLPSELKHYLVSKDTLEHPVVRQKEVDLLMKDSTYSSGLLLKQAREVISKTKSNETTQNLGLIKLALNFKKKVQKESPSSITLQRNMFEKFHDFKIQSNIRNYQLEDYYHKRDLAIPADIQVHLEREKDGSS